MKRSIFLILSIVVVLSIVFSFSFVGCKEEVEEAVEEVEEAVEEVEEAEEAVEEEVPAEEEKFEIVATTMAGNDVVSEQYALAFEKANKNPNLSFDWAPIEYGQLHDKIVLNEAAAAGEFDLHFLITDWLGELIPAGFFGTSK